MGGREREREFGIEEEVIIESNQIRKTAWPNKLFELQNWMDLAGKITRGGGRGGDYAGKTGFSSKDHIELAF